MTKKIEKIDKKVMVKGISQIVKLIEDVIINIYLNVKEIIEPISFDFPSQEKSILGEVNDLGENNFEVLDTAGVVKGNIKFIISLEVGSTFGINMDKGYIDLPFIDENTKKIIKKIEEQLAINE